MDRWLFTFFIGAILSLFLPVIPAFFYVVVSISLGIVCLLNKYSRLISGLFFGGAWILYCAVQYSDVWRSEKLDLSILVQSPQIISGTIDTIPSAHINGSNRNYKFNFRVETIGNKTLINPLIVRLNWNKTQHTLLQGQRWTFKSKLKYPHGFVNSGGFSYQTWLRQHNIVATGYVMRHNANQQLSSATSYRQNLHSKAINLLPEHSLSPLLIALSFGERSQLTLEHWRVLQRTNTQHLIAISGLHLGLIATSSFLFFSFIFRRLPLSNVNVKTLSRFPLSNTRLLAVLLSCCLTFYYAFLAGFSLPTLRALVMLLVFWFIRLSGIQWGLTRWLLVCVFIVIVITPLSIISASFWLSFYAVSIIFLTLWRFKSQFGGTNKITTWIRSLFGVQLCLSLFMLPISMLFNYQISTVSFVANIIAVPILSFTTIPLCLLAVIVMPLSETLSSGLYQLALLNIDAVWEWLFYLAELPWASTHVSLVEIFLVAAGISALGWLCFTSFNKKKMLSYLIMLIVFFIFFKFYNKDDGKWSLTVFDVGQGLSVLVEKNGQAILYDTGASYPSGFNMVDSVVLPYLYRKGINKLDKVIISHSDNDHAGGLSVLKDALQIDSIMANDAKLDANQLCSQGDVFTWQALSFSVLWPKSSSLERPEDELSNNNGDDNDDSCVISISDGNHRVLLTGDISKRVEKLLINDEGLKTLIEADVIVAPHHGSNTSSSKSFIEAVSPERVIFSTGFNNRWNMPAEKVQQRYRQQKVKTYNTAEVGMIEIVFTKSKSNNYSLEDPDKNSKLITFRQHKWPFWFAN